MEGVCCAGYYKYSGSRRPSGAALETYAAQHELTIEVSGFRSGEELLEAAASGGFDIVFST